jgi:hypothetical protein
MGKAESLDVRGWRERLPASISERIGEVDMNVLRASKVKMAAFGMALAVVAILGTMVKAEASTCNCMGPTWGGGNPPGCYQWGQGFVSPQGPFVVCCQRVQGWMERQYC